MLIDFDKVLERVGGFHRYQIIHYILLGISSVPVGMHVMANVFHAGAPDYWCADAAAAPGERGGADACEVVDYAAAGVNVSAAVAANASVVRACTSWNYDRATYGWTITERWNLVCGDAWKRSMTQSILMLGFLMGTIGFGTLSDRIGRKISWYVGLLSMITIGTAATVVPDYWSHSVLRALSVAAAAGYYTIAFVLTMETIGAAYRVQTGIMFQAFFAAGYMLLAGLASLIRDYAHLQLTISLIPVVFLSLYWFIGESPRWLVTQGRLVQARVELRRAARMNKRDFADDILEHEVDHLKKENSLTAEHHFVEPTVVDRRYSIIDLVRTPHLRGISANIFVCWFVNSLVYYGLSMGIAQLSGSVYWNLFFAGVMEIVALVLSTAVIERVGRRWPLCVFMVTGGIACLANVPIPRQYAVARTVLAMVGRFCISGSFGIIYVFSAELFPTVLRNTGVGAGSMCARIGGLLAPFVAEMGHLGWTALPMVIFGFTSVFSGILALALPETLHKQLPETVEDGENFASDSGFPCCASHPGDRDEVTSSKSDIDCRNGVASKV